MYKIKHNAKLSCAGTLPSLEVTRHPLYVQLSLCSDHFKDTFTSFILEDSISWHIRSTENPRMWCHLEMGSNHVKKRSYWIKIVMKSSDPSFCEERPEMQQTPRKVGPVYPGGPTAVQPQPKSSSSSQQPSVSRKRWRRTLPKNCHCEHVSPEILISDARPQLSVISTARALTIARADLGDEWLGSPSWLWEDI